MDEFDDDFDFDELNLSRIKQRARAVVDSHNVIAVPVDFSFIGLANPEDAWTEKPRSGGPKDPTVSKTQSRALRLNNNHLSDYKGLLQLIELYFINLSAVAWLDLSFNLLNSVGKEILQLTQLQILYLHGNVIAKQREVNKLRRLENLRTLTLHGNPIDREKDYRYAVLVSIPHLQKLDFNDVTPSERFVADRLTESILRKVKKRRNY